MLGNMVRSGEIIVSEKSICGNFKTLHISNLFWFSGCHVHPHQAQLPHFLVLLMEKQTCLSLRCSLFQAVIEMGVGMGESDEVKIHVARPVRDVFCFLTLVNHLLN